MAEPAKPLPALLETERDENYGYRVLKTRPAAEEVAKYFREDYYGAIASGEKAADIARALSGGEEAARQARWMRHTLYADVLEMIRMHAPGGRVLEIGCGLGDLLLYLEENGCAVRGVDIAPKAVEAARARGLDVALGDFRKLAGDALPRESLDAILFMNVLEQMPEPDEVIAAAHGLLAPGGVVIVRSGNDFNPLQIEAARATGAGEFWVTADHLSYFSFSSLERLFDAKGLETVAAQGDFPMEMMALLGFDYLNDPAQGGEAHRRRVAFEEALTPEVRRRLYRAFAQAGLGRCLLMAARKRD
ncbi:MAG: class I SAM-dependent methyltransferase [Parvularculaceae bacterium]